MPTEYERLSALLDEPLEPPRSRSSLPVSDTPDYDPDFDYSFLETSPIDRESELLAIEEDNDRRSNARTRARRMMNVDLLGDLDEEFKPVESGRRIPTRAEYFRKQSLLAEQDKIRQGEDDFFADVMLEAQQGGSVDLPRYLAGGAGLLGRLTGSETLKRAGREASEGIREVEAETERARAGIRRTPVSAVTGSVLRSAQSVVPAVPAAIVGAGVVGTAGMTATAAAAAKAAAGVTGSAIVGALQSSTSTFDQAANASERRLRIQDPKADPKAIREQAEKDAVIPALVSGAVTGLITKGFGNTGIESLVTGTVAKGFVPAVRQIANAIGMEAIEEGADQAWQSVISSLSYRPGMTDEEALNEILMAAAAGGLISGTVGGMKLSFSKLNDLSKERIQRRADDRARIDLEAIDNLSLNRRGENRRYLQRDTQPNIDLSEASTRLADENLKATETKPTGRIRVAVPPANPLPAGVNEIPLPEENADTDELNKAIENQKQLDSKTVVEEIPAKAVAREEAKPVEAKVEPERKPLPPPTPAPTLPTTSSVATPAATTSTSGKSVSPKTEVSSATSVSAPVVKETEAAELAKLAADLQAASQPAPVDLTQKTVPEIIAAAQAAGIKTTGKKWANISDKPNDKRRLKLIGEITERAAAKPVSVVAAPLVGKTEAEIGEALLSDAAFTTGPLETPTETDEDESEIGEPAAPAPTFFSVTETAYSPALFKRLTSEASGKTGDKKTVTKRITFFEDQETGEVIGLPTFIQGGEGRTPLLPGEKFGKKKYVTLEERMADGRYVPQGSLLLSTPRDAMDPTSIVRFQDANTYEANFAKGAKATMASVADKPISAAVELERMQQLEEQPLLNVIFGGEPATNLTDGDIKEAVAEALQDGNEFLAPHMIEARNNGVAISGIYDFLQKKAINDYRAKNKAGGSVAKQAGAREDQGDVPAGAAQETNPAQPAGETTVKSRVDGIFGTIIERVNIQTHKAAVQDYLESEHGAKPGGVFTVVNEPDADFDGQAVFDTETGQLLRIEINAAKTPDTAAVDRVITHEVSHLVFRDEKSGVRKVLDTLTDKEQAQISADIDRLGYDPSVTPEEAGARGIEALVNAWNKRTWFGKIVGKVLAWANSKGMKLTRRAAESIAARAVMKTKESIFAADEQVAQGEEIALQSKVAPNVANTLSESEEMEARQMLAQTQPDEELESEVLKEWGVPHRVFGQETLVEDRERLTPAVTEASKVEAKSAYDAAGIPVVSDDNFGGWRVVDDGTITEAKAAKLLELLQNQISRTGGSPGDASGSLITSLTRNYTDGNLDMLSQATKDKLYSYSRGEASHRGLLLRALGLLAPKDLNFIAKNVRTVLSRVYHEAFGGNGVENLLNRVQKLYKIYVGKNDVQLQQVITGLEEMLQEAIDGASRDHGGRVYRRVQALLKPKGKQRLAFMEANARIQEAIEGILQQAKANGVEPKKSTSKLSPLQKLLHLIEPANSERVNTLIQDAVTTGERTAGIKATLASIADPEARAIALEAFNSDPTKMPEQAMIDAGLALPEFAHWKVIRDSLLDYSPVTLKLAQDLIKTDFRGTQFNPQSEKPEDLRIDLLALARDSDSEIRRVLDNYFSKLEKSMNLTGASVETIRRISGEIESQVRAQIAARRKTFLDNFFDPKESIAKTASQRLKTLLNIGVAKDARFTSDPVRKLIKRVVADHLKDEDLSALAKKSRAEKQAWLSAKEKSIDAAEKFSNDEAGDYLRAIVHTTLAERLQAAEETIARSFLKGKDTVLVKEPVAPDAREKSLAESKKKLEGIINAGGIDAAMMNAASKKSAVQRLLPSISDLVKQILATPLYRQAQMHDELVDRLTSDLSIDPALADKAAGIFMDGIKDRMLVARKRAFDKAVKSLTPQQRSEVSGGSKSTMDKIRNLVNAGGMESGEVLREIAKDRGMAEPSDATVGKLKAWALKEQSLRELTAKEAEAVGSDPVALEKAREDKEALNHTDINVLRKRIATEWARLERPINLKNRQNFAAAGNELVSANLLLKIGFPVRQYLQTFSQLLTHYIISPIAQGRILSNDAALIQDKPELWKNIGRSFRDQNKQFVQVMRTAAVNLRTSLKGRGDVQNIERIMSGINALERINLRAEEFWAKKDYGRASAVWLLGQLKWGYRSAQALDAAMGTLIEDQALKYEVRRALQGQGKTPLEVNTSLDFVMGDMKQEWKESMGMAARRFALEHDRTPTQSELQESAVSLMRRRQYQRVKELDLPADAFEESNRLFKETMGWNKLEDRGVGGILGRGVRGVQKFGESLGIPLALGSFSNAVAISTNRMLHFMPFNERTTNFSFDKDSDPNQGWWRTETDRMRRRTEAEFGTAVGAIALAMVAAGLLKYHGMGPRDKEERDLWEREGHRAYTVEFPTPGGFIPISVNNSPLQLVGPYLAAGGGLHDLMEKRSKAQDKLNKAAEKLGIEPGKIKPLGFTDFIGVAGMAGMQAIAGGRTASGIASSFSNDGIPNLAKTVASQVSAWIPGLPAYQEMARMANVNLDSKLATFSDFLVPMPTSPGRKVNMLGEPAGTPDDLQRIIQILTGGTYPLVVSDKAASSLPAYESLFASEYRPPSINPNKGYNIDGKYRPMNKSELEEYTVLRGKLFKDALVSMGATEDPKALKSAFDSANSEALQKVGVSVSSGRSSSGSSSRSSFGGSSFTTRAPRLSSASYSPSRSRSRSSLRSTSSRRRSSLSRRSRLRPRRSRLSRPTRSRRLRVPKLKSFRTRLRRKRSRLTYT